MPADDEIPYRRLDDFLMAFMANANRTSRTMVSGAQQGRRGPRSGKPYAGISGRKLANQTTQNMGAVGRLVFTTATSTRVWSVQRFVAQAIDLIHSNLREKANLKALRTHETYTDYGISAEEVPEQWDLFLQKLQQGVDARTDPRVLAAWCEYQARYVIHPYGDGSGRLATALAAWVMLSAGQRIPNYNFCQREELHAALRQGDEQFQRYYVGQFFPAYALEQISHGGGSGGDHRLCAR